MRFYARLSRLTYTSGSIKTAQERETGLRPGILEILTVGSREYFSVKT